MYFIRSGAIIDFTNVLVFRKETLSRFQTAWDSDLLKHYPKAEQKFPAIADLRADFRTKTDRGDYDLLRLTLPPKELTFVRDTVAKVIDGWVNMHIEAATNCCEVHLLNVIEIYRMCISMFLMLS